MEIYGVGGGECLDAKDEQREGGSYIADVATDQFFLSRKLPELFPDIPALSGQSSDLPKQVAAGVRIPSTASQAVSGFVRRAGFRSILENANTLPLRLSQMPILSPSFF